MKTTKIAIIGGGASGLFLANALDNKIDVTIFERADRLGKKLSSTGNGQGNITNLGADDADYFSVENTDIGRALVQSVRKAHGKDSLFAFFRERGILLLPDETGRVYPASRQASALTDALRFSLANKGVNVCLSTQVTDVNRQGNGFVLTAQTEGREEKYFAETLVFCAGGKSAKNFGTDGLAYALAQKLGHTVTALYPSLVQLKTDAKTTKTLKGIRVKDAVVTAQIHGKTVSAQGDLIFTDYGVSGDAVFRLSAFLDGNFNDVRLFLDFLPDVSEREIYEMLCEKKQTYPNLDASELLFGVINNQAGRCVMKLSSNDLRRCASLVKAFPMQVTGTLGFDYAQVTKGGVRLLEVDENLESKLCKGVYFAGEMLDVDGQCGGYNLQWAYSSARTVARALEEKFSK